jgi:hypothetical protein
MATRFADRLFLTVNGQRVIDLQSCQIKQNHNRKVVQSMTPDGYNRGFTQGNLDVDITATIAVENQLARPKFELIDYENSDVQITAVFGADQLIATGVWLSDNDDNSSNVGEEVKSTFNFKALKITDPIGNSSLFNGAIFTQLAGGS